METRTWVARNLAAAVLAGEWSPEAMERAALSALGEDTAPDWLTLCIAEIHELWRRPYPPSRDELARLILESEAFYEQWYLSERRPRVGSVTLSPARFAPAEAFRDLGLPELSTTGALAAWLALPSSMLEWLADAEGYRTRKGTARHYSTSWIAKRTGPPRLIEAPKPILKIVQRQILRGILDRVPAHDSAHGYRKGRSCITAAQGHAGEAVVVCADLKDFFSRVTPPQVRGLFRSLGYPWPVARMLTALCTTATPDRVLKGTALNAETRTLLRQRHLPQGAPTSPALANLCAWRLDCRLEGLARRLDARYTRYGDDMAFSGGRDFARQIGKLLPLIGEICADSGFRLHPGKTRVMSHGGRQRLLGLVVNWHINVPRAKFDRLKAILHHCRRHGPAGQNRAGHTDFRAHLEGQVSWVESVNPRKGERLRRAFEAIAWP